MSFYFDDDDDELARVNNSDNNNDEAFVCVNCGGSTYYVETTSGAMCCNSCFTESQQLTAESTELDVDEVQALAARSRSGRVLQSASKRKRGGYVPQEKKPLKEYDTSTPFPNLITCLHGMQQVMKHCVEPLCDLVGLTGYSEKKKVEETVQKLWMSYLRAWTDGAEFYGKLHPEIRFSMRDYFLPSQYKAKVMKHLSYKAAQVVRAELDANDEEKKDKSWAADEMMPGNNQETHDNQVLDHSNLTKSHQASIRHFSATYHYPKSLMWMYWHSGKRGRLETALMTLPSMKFVACLLWLAVSRAGVTLNHVLQWISNGALPLENAFKHCLSQDERQALIHVASFFRITKLPTLTEMENLVDKLVVACGLKSFSCLHGISPAAPAAAAAAVASAPDTVVGKDARKKDTTITAAVERPDFSYVTPKSVPLLTARLVKDLGFGKQILDRSLALMGILTHVPSHVWHPGPLEGARPQNLATAAQVLAVIAVACRMTPGWETWAYPGPMALALSNNQMDESDDEIVDFQKREQEEKRRRVESESSRFVPYNEEHVRLLRNGPLVEGYLDFLEDHILDEIEAIFPRFRSTLKTPNLEKTAWSSDSRDEEKVVQRQVLKESWNPFCPERPWRRQKMHDWKLRLKRKRAQWADANGLGEYVIYADPDTHAKDMKRVGKRKRISIPEPFHSQYGLLLEYMSYKANVSPSKIHAAIVVLDDEVLRLVRPREKSS